MLLCAKERARNFLVTAHYTNSNSTTVGVIKKSLRQQKRSAIKTLLLCFLHEATTHAMLAGCT
jgi:hypothetical protein